MLIVPCLTTIQSWVMICASETLGVYSYLGNKAGCITELPSRKLNYWSP